MACNPTPQYTDYLGDGLTTTFQITFSYIKVDEVKVRTGEFPDYVDVPSTDYSIPEINPNSVVFNVAPANGTKIRIYRCTNADVLPATFQAGGAIRAADLNDNFTTMLNIVQDANVRSEEASNDAESVWERAEEAVEIATDAKETADEALTIANEAKEIAEDADQKVDEIIGTIRDQIQYVPVPNVAAIPASPAENDGVQVQDSTGIESFTPLTGLPSGFVGDTGLSSRIFYNGTTWEYVSTLVLDPDNRYANVTGDNFTGNVTKLGNTIPSVVLGTSEPTEPYTGDYWADTTASAEQPTLKMYNGTTWINVGSGGGGGLTAEPGKGVFINSINQISLGNDWTGFTSIDAEGVAYSVDEYTAEPGKGIGINASKEISISADWSSFTVLVP